MAYPHQLTSSPIPRSIRGVQLSASNRSAFVAQLGRALKTYYGPVLTAEVPRDIAELVARLDRKPGKPRLVA